MPYTAAAHFPSPAHRWVILRTARSGLSSLPSKAASAQRSNLAHWWCLRVKSNRHRQVHRALLRNGLEPYLPTIAERRTLRGKKIIHHSQMFVGYAFAKTASDVWRRLVFPHDAIHGPVKVSGHPASVSDDLIEAIRKVENQSHGFTDRAKLQPGTRVRVGSGPFEDRRGRFKGLDTHGRMRVLLTLLGSEREILLDDRTPIEAEPGATHP